jgi:hypothetical protein
MGDRDGTIDKGDPNASSPRASGQLQEPGLAQNQATTTTRPARGGVVLETHFGRHYPQALHQKRHRELWAAPEPSPVLPDSGKIARITWILKGGRGLLQQLLVDFAGLINEATLTTTYLSSKTACGRSIQSWSQNTMNVGKRLKIMRSDHFAPKLIWKVTKCCCQESLCGFRPRLNGRTKVKKPPQIITRSPILPVAVRFRPEELFRHPPHGA